MSIVKSTNSTFLHAFMGKLAKLLRFIEGLFSETLPDGSAGSPSSSRVLTFILATGCLLLLSYIVLRVVGSPADEKIWVPELPSIIGAMTAFAGLAYGINRLSGKFGSLKSLAGRFGGSNSGSNDETKA